MEHDRLENLLKIKEVGENSQKKFSELFDLPELLKKELDNQRNNQISEEVCKSQASTFFGKLKASKGYERVDFNDGQNFFWPTEQDLQKLL